MPFRISCVPHDDGTTALYFENIGHWDNFDWIVGLLEQENGCTINTNDKLVYMRVAKLSWKNIDFEVRHDDMLGNYLYAANMQDVAVLKQLSENVIKSITQRLNEKRSVL